MLLHRFYIPFTLINIATIITADATISIEEAIQKNLATYQKCHDVQQFNFQPFPINYQPQHQPNNPSIAETFILTIPNGCAYSTDGIIIVNNQIIPDLIWPNEYKQKAVLEKLDPKNLPTKTKIKGRVAVITQSGGECFYHWLAEILGRLALLEAHKIQYDHLLVAQTKPYMKESLQLWGIDSSKMIEPCGQHEYIQADELIVPSLINRVQPDLAPNLASYPSPWIINYLRNKILPKIEVYSQDYFAKKIFISRKDAAMRKFTNEDELFEKLEQHGFQRYFLTELSFLQQISLFHHAEIIVAPHGAGLANLIFAQPQTHVIELFQARQDATYWYLSQSNFLNHTCIQTCPFNQLDLGHFDTEFSKETIENIHTMLQ